MTSDSKAEPLHPIEVVTSIYFVRHGHTEATEQGKLYTDPSVALTDAGRKQAEAAGRYLVSEKTEILLSSTSKRVFTSAELIGSVLNLKPQAVPGLDEWHVGEWDGRTYVDIKASHPDLYKAWSTNPIHNRPPGGESIEDVFERAKTKLGEIIETNSGKKIVLVSHAGIIRSFIVHAMGMPINNFWRVNIPVGSITKIDFSANFATMQMMAIRPIV